jgi:hypothetical protein
MVTLDKMWVNVFGALGPLTVRVKDVRAVGVVQVGRERNSVGIVL